MNYSQNDLAEVIGLKSKIFNEVLNMINCIFLENKTNAKKLLFFLLLFFTHEASAQTTNVFILNCNSVYYDEFLWIEINLSNTTKHKIDLVFPDNCTVSRKRLVRTNNRFTIFNAAYKLDTVVYNDEKDVNNIKAKNTIVCDGALDESTRYSFAYISKNRVVLKPKQKINVYFTTKLDQQTTYPLNVFKFPLYIMGNMEKYIKTPQVITLY